MNDWAQHYQAVWQERSGDPLLPAWLRVACLAYGMHRRNGHAVFRRGHIALVLASPDPDTGEITPMDRRNVWRAIQTAIQLGWLDKRSYARCLVVPEHAITGGGKGHPYSPCPEHERRRA